MRLHVSVVPLLVHAMVDAPWRISGVPRKQILDLDSCRGFQYANNEFLSNSCAEGLAVSTGVYC